MSSAQQATPPPSADRYRLLSAVIAAAAAAEVIRQLARGTKAAYEALFRRQVLAATFAERFVVQMLTEQSYAGRTDGRLNPIAFTTPYDTFSAMVDSIQTDQKARIERLATSLTQEASRAAQQVSVAVREDVRWVRHLTLPSCSRCAVLAGRVYRYSQGFQRHPGCFPAGTVVSGPGASRATRRWYEGELVVIRTAGGKNLTATANHPILTSDGWLPANLLAEGSHVVGRSSGDRSGSLLVPDHDQVPSRIEDIWSSGRMGSLGRVPVSPEDFHGDGLGSSHVDVVLTDGLMRDEIEVTLLQQLREELFAIRVELAVALNASGARLQFGHGHLAATGGPLGGFGLSGAIFGEHLGGAQQPSLAWSSNLDLRFNQSAPNDYAADARAIRDRILALPSEVGGNQIGVRNGKSSPPRWDAPAVPFSMENRSGYSTRGQDLFERLAGRVELDRVVELRRVGFAGHVFNLTSNEGWYDAEGIIVSNCDCVMVPTTVASPDLTYDPIELARDGQVTGLSKADRRALDEGADFAQIVNVRAKAAGLSESGQVLARAGRMTPAGIFDLAGDDRDYALELLRKYEYIR